MTKNPASVFLLTEIIELNVQLFGESVSECETKFKE